MASLTADFARAAALADALGAPRVLEEDLSELDVTHGRFAIRLDITKIDPTTLQETIRKAGFAPSSPVQYALTFLTEEPVTIRSPEPITSDSWTLPRPFHRADFGLRWTSHERQRSAIEGYNGIVSRVFLDIIYPPSGFVYGIDGKLVETSKTKAARKRRRLKKHEQLEKLKLERVRVEQEAKEEHQKALAGAGIFATLDDVLAMLAAAKTPEDLAAAQCRATLAP